MSERQAVFLSASKGGIYDANNREAETGDRRCRKEAGAGAQQAPAAGKPKILYEKGARQKRTHRLITRGGAVESIAPLAKVLGETEFYAFTEKAFALPEVRALLMEAVNAHNEASQKGKG